jgi:hypothetical protein
VSVAEYASTADMIQSIAALGDETPTPTPKSTRLQTTGQRRTKHGTNTKKKENAYKRN